MKIAEIYLDVNTGIDRSYEYLVPDSVQIGNIVSLPFGYRKTKGIVTNIKEEADYKGQLKKINFVDKKKSLNINQLRLSFFIKDKFKLPLYKITTFFATATNEDTEESIFNLLNDKKVRGKNQVLIIEELKKGPKTFNQLKRVIPSLSKRTIDRLLELEVIETKRVRTEQNLIKISTLPPIQRNAFIKLNKVDQLAELLFNELEKIKGQILVVFPNKFKARRFSEFLEQQGFYPTLFLNDLPKKQKEIIINNINQGNFRVVVGTHSSIFLPFKDLEEIIVSETGNLNYYSNEVTKYNLIEVIEAISQLWNKKIIFTDFIDSVLSIYKKSQDLWKQQEIFDSGNQKIEYINNENSLLTDNFLSKKLDPYLNNASKNEKVYIVLNRISLKKVPYCNQCGHSLKCPECNAFLQLDEDKNEIFCSRCGYKTEKFEECPECNSNRISYNDIGSPRLKEILKESLKNKTIKSADERDLVNSEIIIGTIEQLKFLHLKNIKTILAVTIDTDLNNQNFLNAERTLRNYSEALIEYPNSEFIMQSNSYNNSFYSGLTQLDDLFLTQDFNFRQSLKLPPFYDLYLFTFQSKNPILADNDSKTILDRIKRRFKNINKLEIQNPYQVKNREGKTVTKFIIKDPTDIEFSEFLSQMIDEGEFRALNSEIQLLVNPSVII